MYELYYAGKFGNTLAQWKTVDDYLNSDFAGLVVLRYKEPGSPWCKYGLTKSELQDQMAQWIKDGAKKDKFTVNELANDSDLIIQGEVERGINGLHVRYSKVPKPMRIALAEDQFHVDGLQAVNILKSSLDPSSYDWLHELLDTYPGAVVEFSTWAHDVGVIKNRNTVFWEVRHY